MLKEYENSGQAGFMETHKTPQGRINRWVKEKFNRVTVNNV
jgi:hypothetical protein